MPNESIRFTVNGPNSTQNTVSTVTTPSGTGSTLLTYTGTNAGVDTVQAFLDNRNLSSNQVAVVWQPTNGSISVSSITAYVNNTPGNSVFPAGTSPTTGSVPAQYSSPYTFNSLMFNTNPASLIPGFGNNNANITNPITNEELTTTGAYSFDSPFIQQGPLDIVLLGSFVVASAGNISFTAYVNASFIVAIPNATCVSGPQFYSGVTTTPFRNYGPTVGFNGAPWPGGNYAVENFIINFSSPGIYPFEILFASGTFNEKEFALIANGATIPPISLVSVPPPGATPSGNLTINPTVFGPFIVGEQADINLAISGLTYNTQPYIPLLEGTAGDIGIYNDPNNNTFTLPFFNGQTIDPPTAAASIFSITADNNNWQGRLSVAYVNSKFALSYNGNAFDPGVSESTLTIVQDDVAWYNPTNKSYDVFNATNTGGGKFYTIQVQYLVSPVVASIFPLSVPGNLAIQTFTVTLAKPLPPPQISMAFGATGGTGLSVVPGSGAVIVSNGWVSGYSFQAIVGLVNSATVAPVTLTFQETLTYLSGESFVTNSVGFPASQQSITIFPQNASVLENQNFTVASSMSSVSKSLKLSALTVTPPPFVLTAVVTNSQNTFSDVSFYYQTGSGTQTLIATVPPSSVVQSGSNWVGTFTTSIQSLLLNGTYNFGYTVTTVDSQSYIYWDTTSYPFTSGIVPVNGDGGVK